MDFESKGDSSVKKQEGEAVQKQGSGRIGKKKEGDEPKEPLTRKEPSKEDGGKKEEYRGPIVLWGPGC